MSRGGIKAPAREAIEGVKARVAAAYGVSLADLLGPKRAPNLVEARHVAMAISRELTGASFPEIAREFERKNHNSVRHGCKAVFDRRGDPAFWARFVRLLSESREIAAGANLG